jgi:hypothetical protein
MQVALDVVDLLQLQEIWSKRPIVTAFTRLESRPPVMLPPVSFGLDELLPRLARLKQSSAWLLKNGRLNADPARVPMAEFSEDFINEMYPESPSAAERRQALFNAVYDRYIVACYRGSVHQTIAALQALGRARQLELDEHLGSDALPLPGSPEWIPFNITDEIRSLDKRYDPVQPGAPATYVVSDAFWPLLVKAAPADIEEVIRLQCASSLPECIESFRALLTALSEVAYMWNRSPSVVGLCYQLSD